MKPSLVNPAQVDMLTERPVFNENGDDSIQNRQLIGGQSTGIANLNSIRYKWASPLYNTMRDNFWIPQKTSLVDDRISLKELTPHELEATKDTLSFLIALDSMQVATLPKVANYVTAPEVTAIYTLQAYQEQIHSDSYQYILQELFPSLDREEIYNRWRTNKILLERNRVIAKIYQDFANEKTHQNFKRVLAADFALEGIYFYSGFTFFHLLSSRNKLPNVDKIITYIQNDEVTHVSFFNHQIREVFDKKNDEDVSLLRDTLMNATAQEIEWGHHTYGDNILGITKESTEAYIKYLANQRAKLLDIGTLYRGYSKNPYAYLDEKKKENFFETSVTEYSQSSAVSGWDDF